MRRESALRKPQANTGAILHNINWDFSTPFSVGRSGTQMFDCRRHHWYPATYIPELPFTLIEVLTRPGDVVFDPFAGIGTSLIQASLQGRRPYGTELCGVAAEMIRCFWTILGPSRPLTRFSEVVSLLVSAPIRRRRCESISAEYLEKLRPWFNEETFRQVTALSDRIALLKRPGDRALARVAFSATLKAVSAQDQGWGCIADNVLPKKGQLAKPRDALKRFATNYAVLYRAVENARESLTPQAARALSVSVKNVLLEGDVRETNLTQQPLADLVVTSPPYPGMTDYATSQRLSYYWLGRDPAVELRREIGARRYRFSDKALQAYQDAMSQVAAVVRAQTRSGGHLCLVLPVFEGTTSNGLARRRAVHDCVNSFERAGFVMYHELERLLPSRRRHHNQNWTSIERETIYVLRAT